MSIEDNSIIAVGKQEVSVSRPKVEIKSPDENMLERIKRTGMNDNGTWIAFDWVRKGLGDRDIYATKVFFESLRLLNFIEKDGTGYKPTEEAITKYPNWFVLEEDTKKWGMRPGIREDFEEEYVYPIYTPMAARVMAHFKEEKRIKANEKAKIKRAKEKRDIMFEKLSTKGKLV